MIPKIKTISLILALVTMSFTSVQAQKLGHLNSGNLLELLPETKVAGKELETFQKKLLEAYEIKVKAFEAKVQAFYDPESRKNKTPVQLQDEQNALATEEQGLLQEQKDVDQKVFEKRQLLLKPIFEKVDIAIKAVAEEQGFQMIFDSSVFNTILFKEDSHDILEAVKAKLGLKEE